MINIPESSSSLSARFFITIMHQSFCNHIGLNNGGYCMTFVFAKRKYGTCQALRGIHFW